MIEKGLVSFILDQSDITAHISNRIYPVMLPQGYNLPALSYQRISGDRLQGLTGPVNKGHPRIRIYCFAHTYSKVKQLAEDVRQSLDGYSGTMGSVQVGNVTIEGERDDFEETTEIYRVIQEYLISHTEV